MKKEGEGYVLHADVEEVVLNCTVLEGNRLVPDLTEAISRSWKTVSRRP